MCGIVGIKSNETLGEIIKMLTTVEHRGPDDVGFECAGAYGLGFRRLSMRPASIGPVKHLIRQISLEELRDVVNNARATAQPVRRAVTEFLAQL